MGNHIKQTSHIMLNPTKIKSNISTIASKLSISKWDLSASSSNDISVQVFNGQPKQLKASQRNSITVRVWNKDNAVGITSTSDLSENGLEKALKTALEASSFGNIDQSPEFSPLAKEKLPSLERPIRNQSGVKKLFDQLKKAEKLLIDKHEAIESVPYNGFAESDYERLYINSEESIRSLRNTQSSLYLYAKAQVKGGKPRTGGSIKLGYGSTDIKLYECIEEAANKTISHLNYRPIETGRYLVCFSPESFLELITSFSNIFNARSIIDGISLSNKDSIGQKISHPILNLHDNGLHHTNIGGITFDGEGTPTKSIQLIKNGVLENFIHSEATAREFGTSPTGHAGIGTKVSVSPDWLIISKNKDITSPENGLDHTKTPRQFVLIENLNALHAGIKASQGSFSLPFDGWLVKDGEKISIEAATIAGDIKILLNNIVEIEEAIHSTHVGVSPHVWVQDMSITGEK